MNLQPEPLLLVALAIPLILDMIPRNGFYGFRTPRTLASDDVWYPANRYAGKALFVAGLVWAALPLMVQRNLVNPLGLTVLGAAVGASFVYLSRIGKR